MTAPGPGWEGRAADPWPAPSGLGPPTVPLPYGSVPAARPARRRRRWPRRLAGAVTVMVTVAAAAFGALYAITPSVGTAPALARAIDQAHHVAYPGPPVPSRFAESLVATEDHRFYSEPGVDVYAVARVAWGRLTGRADQGGATLYQQLAKMLYTPEQSGLLVQAKQVMLGIKLYLRYSRAQILRMYADVAYFGHGYYGLAAASCGYFGKVPARLTLPQAATLAGLVQAPTLYDPIAHYATGRAREAHVLARLVATGRITTAREAAAFARPLHLVGGRGTGCRGLSGVRSLSAGEAGRRSGVPAELADGGGSSPGQAGRLTAAAGRAGQRHVADPPGQR